ncbi:MAG: DUF2946 family protein [Rhodoferax sp.]|uniref:DUF2946 family protein n=1 Tax=Rhodoferax sp. TaxID=50421 RepID=UPI001B7A7FAF|nr:DUF2946 family protein [Rhodoferax sp.]MBP9906094.1 DUF2946 family protein [Rhodoferax sp.]
MHRSRPSFRQIQPQRPWALWLALLLALFAALAPTVSHALNWSRGDTAAWVEVCTSTGPRWMALAPSPDRAGDTDFSALAAASSDAPDSAQILEHCPFCLLLAERAAPPPSAWPADFVASGHALAPAPAPQQFLPTFIAPAPPSRAPPHAI